MKNGFHLLIFATPGDFVPTDRTAVVDWEMVDFLRRDLDTA